MSYGRPKPKAMAAAKEILLRLLTQPALVAPLARLLRGRATIFMLHRFASPEIGCAGHDPGFVRTVLAWLRRERYQLLPLDVVFARLAGEGPPLERAVAFTLDDGYLDQAAVAGPLFAEFDCPATTFVATGFLDGEGWFWWDKLEHVLRHTKRREASLSLEGSAPLRFALDGDGSRLRAQNELGAALKRLHARAREAAITALAADCEVALPTAPPTEYAPMSWDQLRACERSGMSFGAHTVSHPILSRATDEESRRELEGSWRRLRERAERPLPIFCYPNGQADDFGPREIETLRGLGFRGALTGVPGYASARDFASDGARPFQVRRFALPGDLPRTVQLVSGLERAKEIARGER